MNFNVTIENTVGMRNVKKKQFWQMFIQTHSNLYFSFIAFCLWSTLFPSDAHLFLCNLLYFLRMFKISVEMCCVSYGFSSILHSDRCISIGFATVGMRKALNIQITSLWSVFIQKRVQIFQIDIFRGNQVSLAQASLAQASLAQVWLKTTPLWLR